MSTHKIKGEDYYQCRDVKAERDKLLEEVAELLDRLEAAEKTNGGWLRANATGGWIDNLRIENDTLRAKIDQLEEDTKAALTSNSIAQPPPSVPTGWKLVPIDPTRNMLDIMDLGSNMLYRYRALLAAAPKPEGE